MVHCPARRAIVLADSRNPKDPSASVLVAPGVAPGAAAVLAGPVVPVAAVFAAAARFASVAVC